MRDRSPMRFRGKENTCVVSVESKSRLRVARGTLPADKHHPHNHTGTTTTGGTTPPTAGNPNVPLGKMHRPTKQKQGDKHFTPVREPGLGRLNRGCCAGRPGTVCAVRDGGTPRPWTVGWLGDCRVAGCTGEFRAVGGCVDGTTGSLNLYENTPSMSTPTRSRKPSAQGVSIAVANANVSGQ